jgi:hypothetical protein
MFQFIRKETTNNTDLAVSYSKVYDLDNSPVYGCSVQAVYADATPVVQPFVAADVTIDPDNTITIVDHGFITGLKVALAGTNLPTGLSAGTYYVIVIDADTIQLASTLVNAEAGTEEVITAAGTTADATLTPSSLAGVVVKLQMSNDGVHYTDISGKTVTISAAGSVLWDLGAVTYRYLRVLETPSAGALDLDLYFVATNDF